MTHFRKKSEVEVKGGQISKITHVQNQKEALKVRFLKIPPCMFRGQKSGKQVTFRSLSKVVKKIAKMKLFT